MARKIDQTLKIHKLERKCSQNGDTHPSFFSKLPMMKILFTCSSIGAKVKSSVVMLKPVKVMTNVRNARKVAMKVKSGYVTLYTINGTNNLSNFI